MIRSLVTVLAVAVVSSAHAAQGAIPDPTFGNGGFAFLTLDGVEGHELRAGAAATLPDGSVLFGGSRNLRVIGNPDPHVRAMLARMHADGSPDTGFGVDPANPGIRVMDDLVPGTASQQIEALQVLEGGSIIAAGTAQAFGPLTCFVVRTDAHGERDMTFGGTGLATVARAHCHSLAVDAAGGIVVAGERLTDAGAMEAFLARFDGNGTRDMAFGVDGFAALAGDVEDESGYVNALSIGPNGTLVAGGAYETYGAGMGTDFSLARFDAQGRPDRSFAGTGWRVFHADGDASRFNGIDRLIVGDDGSIVFAGHRIDAQNSVRVVLGGIAADGSADAAFGTGSGFAPIDFADDASARYATGLVRQKSGRFIASALTAGPGKSVFLAFRFDAHGALDRAFGEAGIASVDLAPAGLYSDATALTLQGDEPIVAGSVQRDPSSRLVDLGAVRLVDRDAGNDAIFTDGFESADSTHVTRYDDLQEGFLGTAFDLDGIHYHDCNGLDGVFPDGSTFAAADIGDNFTIENATAFYADFPGFGSSPNALTFGDGYINGDNFSIGAMERASMDLGAPANAARFDLAYYENGPWGGIVLHLDAVSEGQVVASDSLTIADAGGRDNVTTASLQVQGATFDGLRLYATYGAKPSAPRVMIDNLSITTQR